MKQLNVLILFLIFFHTFPGLANAEKVVPFPQLGKPNSITVDKNHVYITDQGSIAIYSLENFKLERTFGRQGEGPGEFRLLPQDKIGLRIALLDDYILVNSPYRVSFFSKQGEFKNQIDLTDLEGWRQFLKPLGKKFVGNKRLRVDNMLYLTINLYDPQGLQIEKEIYRKEYYGQMGDIPDCLALAMPMKDESRRGALYQVYNNHLFVEGKNNEIHVFDQSGKKLYTIVPDCEKIKIPESFKQEVLAFFEKRYPTIYRIAKQKGKFPEYFPIRNFHVDDNKLYVLNFKNQEGKSEFYILDVKGKFLKKIMIPFEEAEFLQAYPYTISNEKCYQLIENLDTEEWELHINEV
jgi:hypothetical protein